MKASDSPTGAGFSRQIERRAAIKWMMTAAASLPFAQLRLHGESSATINAKGYGTDADLTRSYNPGDFWPLTLTDAQRRTTAALCDTIIPADGKSPSASSVGVVDFIDEWISAPYPQQQEHRPVILDGLDWIDREAGSRFKKGFADLSENQRNAICDDICLKSAARPAFAKAAAFFALFRNLTAGGFYTTPEGTKDLNYIGNVPLATFDGPPPELIRQLGLA